jgi:uncharacterized RDD family membrane protein YckC
MKKSAPTALPPSFFRRLGAIFYDALLLLGLLFLATALLLPFSTEEAFSPNHPLYSLYLFFTIYLFFCWFWTRGGQTLGMRAWKIKVVDANGKGLNWIQATLRFFAALLSWVLIGLGFIWILFNKERNGWHDLLSNTRIDWAEK